MENMFPGLINLMTIGPLGIWTHFGCTPL